MAAKKGPKKHWPKWFYGPGYTAPAHGQAENPEFARICATQQDVPEGWVDHPAKLLAVAEAPPPAAPARGAGRKKEADAPKVDAAAEAAAKAAEERRQHLLKLARSKHGNGVPANATIDELVSGLGGEAGILAAEQALNGNGR